MPPSRLTCTLSARDRTQPRLFRCARTKPNPANTSDAQLIGARAYVCHVTAQRPDDLLSCTMPCVTLRAGARVFFDVLRHRCELAVIVCEPAQALLRGRPDVMAIELV